MLDYRKIVTPAILSYPEIKTVDGQNYKLQGFQQTQNGFEPIYTETDELTSDQVVSILMGGAE